MRVSIRLIEIFVRVVESGSFVAAARGLLIDPAAVSRAIKNLEHDLGVLLFTRSTRSLRLTTEGRRFYRDGADLLGRFEETLQRFRSDRAVQGQLKVGMGPALSRRMLSRAIEPFQTLYPDVGLVLLGINAPVEIGDEGVDIFVRPGSQRQRGGEHKPPQAVVLRTLARSPIVLCAAPKYIDRMGAPRTPADLPRHTCTAVLTLERDVQDEWHLLASNSREKVKIVPKLIADGETLREAGIAGCGIIRLLACNVEDELRSGALVRVLPEWDAGSLPIVATYRKTRPAQSRVNALVKHLGREFRAGAPAGG